MSRCWKPPRPDRIQSQSIVQHRKKAEECAPPRPPPPKPPRPRGAPPRKDMVGQDNRTLYSEVGCIRRVARVAAPILVFVADKLSIGLQLCWVGIFFFVQGGQLFCRLAAAALPHLLQPPDVTCRVLALRQPRLSFLLCVKIWLNTFLSKKAVLKSSQSAQPFMRNSSS